MTDKPLVYLAAPYSKNPVRWTSLVMELANILQGESGEGHCWCFIPHLTLFYELQYPRLPDFYYEWDKAVLKRCDMMYVMQGSEDSVGVQAEIIFAKEHKIPVIRSRPALDVAIAAWQKKRKAREARKKGAA
jgi:hypothetical protein